MHALHVSQRSLLTSRVRRDASEPSGRSYNGSVVHRPIWPRRIVDSSTWLEAGFRNAWRVVRMTYGLLSHRNVAAVMYINTFGRTTGSALILTALLSTANNMPKHGRSNASEIGWR